MKTIPCAILLWAVLLTPASFAGGKMNAGGEPNPGWEKLKTLVGTWEAKGPDGKVLGRSAFKLTSKDSALAETMAMGKEDEMLTVIHPDGKRLVMTHYCAAGNQPRMRSDGKVSEDGKLAFKFHDITNLSSRGAEHMREVTYTLKDKDHFTAEWTSRASGKDTPYLFEFSRVR